jgi:hypothetical protein
MCHRRTRAKLRGVIIHWAISLVAVGMLFGHATAAPAASPSTTPVVRSAASGLWSAASTWEGGKLPAVGDKVLIREGHTVVYDVSSTEVLRSLHIAGTLSFAHDKDTRLEVGLIRIEQGENLSEEGFDCLVHVPGETQKPKQATGAENKPGFTVLCDCCQSKAALLVGTPDQPVDANRSALIRLHYIEGMDKESCPAIICCGGRMDFHGAPMNRTWVKLGADVDPRKGPVFEITLAEPVTGWRAGDRVVVTTSGMLGYKQGGTEEATIKSIDGTTVVLDQPLTYFHSGSGEHRSEVANLTRNVVVESADPNGIRGHTMYHHGSGGAISYAEFRHLGKRDVLGRYGIHYHLVGDSMRGASVIGASIWDSHNRWITIHGTNYLVVRDCVGFKSIGHGFFLEDGTEVYNVFDRNLACQALQGRPLPKQVLPFDKNDGAGFWWSNSLNTFTRNVGVECGQYGFRFDAAPRAGVVVDKLKYGEPNELFNLVLPVRQPDGGSKPVDIRTLPFVRFEDNESHSNGKWGINLGTEGVGGVGPDPSTPFVIRNMKVWAIVGGFGVEAAHVLIDGMHVDAGPLYATRESIYVGQDYRNVTLKARGHEVSTVDQYLAAGSLSRLRQPGWPRGNGDGGADYQDPEIEVATLEPVDKLPPLTVITHVVRHGDKLVVRGTTSDDGAVRQVLVNGQPAHELSPNFAQWEISLDASPGSLTLTAQATDEASNVEQTPHAMSVVIQ